VDFYFDEGGPLSPGHYDTAKEIVLLAMMEEVITRRGAFYEYDGQRWRGKDSVIEAIRDDADLYASIASDVSDAMTLAAR